MVFEQDKKAQIITMCNLEGDWLMSEGVGGLDHVYNVLILIQETLCSISE